MNIYIYIYVCVCIYIYIYIYIYSAEPGGLPSPSHHHERAGALPAPETAPIFRTNLYLIYIGGGFIGEKTLGKSNFEQTFLFTLLMRQSLSIRTFKGFHTNQVPTIIAKCYYVFFRNTNFLHLCVVDDSIRIL